MLSPSVRHHRTEAGWLETFAHSLDAQGTEDSSEWLQQVLHRRSFDQSFAPHQQDETEIDETRQDFVIYLIIRD